MGRKRGESLLPRRSVLWNSPVCNTTTGLSDSRIKSLQLKALSLLHSQPLLNKVGLYQVRFHGKSITSTFRTCPHRETCMLTLLVRSLTACWHGDSSVISARLHWRDDLRDLSEVAHIWRLDVIFVKIQWHGDLRDASEVSPTGRLTSVRLQLSSCQRCKILQLGGEFSDVTSCKTGS